MKKRVFICIFVLIFNLLSFDVAFLQGWIVAMIVFGALFAGCLVWLCRLIELGESWSYRRIRRLEKRVYKGIDDEFKKLRKEIDGKADKKVDISNVRPGNRPSDKYKAMVGGEALDSRRKD